MTTALAKGILATGSLAGEVEPPADGLAVTISQPITSTASTKPTVRWTHEPGTSIQLQWLVDINLGIDNVYTSGWILGLAEEHQIPVDLSAGASYICRVSIITDFPSNAFDSTSFVVVTPDLIDQVGDPFLRHTAELILNE